MVTGWKKDNGKWHYLRPQGDMATGWVKDGSSWYYLDGQGTMVTGWLSYRGSLVLAGQLRRDGRRLDEYRQ